MSRYMVGSLILSLESFSLQGPFLARKSGPLSTSAFLMYSAHPVAHVKEVLAPQQTVEVNLFHRTEARVRIITQILRRAGAPNVLGLRPDARIPKLESKRAVSHRRGVFGADVVLVPLEDGDRAEALVRMGKVVISVDLNPLSRTSQKASVPIVDEVRRALPTVEKFVRELRKDPEEAARIAAEYDRAGNLGAVYSFLDWRLGILSRRVRPKQRPKRSRAKRR